MPVAGLDGGADGDPEPGGPAATNPSPAPSAGCSVIGKGEAVLDAGPNRFRLGEAVSPAAGGPVTLIGGVAMLGSGGTGGVSVSLLMGGAPAALTALEGGPFGGGSRGGSAAAGASPAFLFTHFLSSLS